jgi:lipopolysaccharide export system permease protein
MSILDRHIGRSILTSTLLVFVVLTALFTFIKFVDALGDLGKATFGLYEVVRYVVLSVPRQAGELFPITALLGATLGLSSLAADSELIAMRAAGVSLARLVGAVVKVGMLLVLLAMVVGEVVAPVTEDMAERGRSSALQVSVRQQKDSGLWVRDGQMFVHLGEVLPDLSVLRVNIYTFDTNNQLRLQTSARRGRYEKEKEVWRLQDVRQSRLDDGRVRVRQIDADEWVSVLTPDMLAVFAVKPEGLSIWRLYRYIQHLELNKQDTGRYNLAFWNKLMSPLAAAVMMVLAVPFVFSQMRSSGVGSRLMIGIMLGLAFYVISRGFGYFGLLYGVPPIVGAVIPTLLFLGIAAWMLRRVG